MARKKTKRFDDGGEIVVRGVRDNRIDLNTLDQIMRGAGGAPTGGEFGSMGGGYGGGGGGASSVRSTPMQTPKQKAKFGKVPTPAGNVYGVTVPVSDRASLGLGLGRGVIGQQGQPLAGANFRMGFKKGGKVKKMAHGGTASKRGDGIASKGKTKGRFV